MCEKFQQKILNSMVVGAEFFNFSDRKPGILEIIEVCFNLDIGFCITCDKYYQIIKKISP